MAAVNIYKQLFKGDRDEVQIRLGPSTDTAFRIVDPQGAPIKGATVEPWHWKVPNYAYDIPPDDIRAATQGISDADGIAKLPAMRREGFRTVQVTASGFGTQQLQLQDSDQRRRCGSFVCAPSVDSRCMSRRQTRARQAAYALAHRQKWHEETHGNIPPERPMDIRTKKGSFSWTS